MMNNFDSESLGNYFKQDYSVQLNDQFDLSMLNQSSYNQQFCKNLQEFAQVSQSKIIPPKSVQYQDMKHLNNRQNEMNFSNIELICQQSHKKSSKMELNYAKARQRLIAIKGFPRQTLSISTNLKSELLNFLRKGLKLRLYNQQQKKCIQKFAREGKNMESIFSLLQQHNEIRENFLQHYCSGKMIQNIMKSSSMHFTNKIIFIKYMNHVYQNLEQFHQKNKWKAKSKLTEIPEIDEHELS